VNSWPSSDPLVTSIGGTPLHVDAAGNRLAPDQVWNDGFGAGGGGLSKVFGRPEFQDGVERVVGDARHPTSASARQSTVARSSTTRSSVRPARGKFSAAPVSRHLYSPASSPSQTKLPGTDWGTSTRRSTSSPGTTTTASSTSQSATTHSPSAAPPAEHLKKSTSPYPASRPPPAMTCRAALAPSTAKH
jgi:hypothetical protein